MYSKKYLIESDPQRRKPHTQISQTLTLLLQPTTNQITPLTFTLEISLELPEN